MKHSRPPADRTFGLRVLFPGIGCLALGAPLLAAPQAIQLPPPAGGAFDDIRKEAPFRVLDNHEGQYMDLVLAPIRPMVRASNGSLLALNNHDSTLVEYDSAGALVRTIRLPWGPVSVALRSGEQEALVVCRGSQALVRIDLASGDILGAVELESEPADIVLHPTSGHAFVSCAGTAKVLEIDVDTLTVERGYRIPSLAPTFLSLDGNDVLVAPMLSGNNSLAETGDQILDAGPGRVLDLEDPTIAQVGLPDHDLFRITPGNAPVAVARDTGSVLFAQGINPATGQFWQLGTEANNKDATRQGEAAIEGEVVFNQVSLSQLAGGQVVEPMAVINLDDSQPGTPGVQYDRTRTVGQPYALSFDGAGAGYIAGLLSDNVTQLSASGAFVREWNVGSIPRAVLSDEPGERAWVYCWGSNTVEVYDLQGAPQLVDTLDLGYDPTPALIAEGRRIYFSGEFSEHGNASCNSCHIEGDSDMLVWDLSDLAKDDKGPLVTQTLRGIEDQAPFHWRGERADLLSFNSAFDGLLGGAELDTTPGGEFDAFQAFVFSMQQPANPLENERRVVDASIPLRTPEGLIHVADAVRGQISYFDEDSINGFGSCNACHTMPTGTNNDIVLDEPFLEDAHRNHFVVAAFNGLWRKEQRTLETVIFADGSSEERPTLGSGLSAAGLKDSLLDFVQIPLFDLTTVQDFNISAFVSQADSGLAPAVHKVVVLGSVRPRENAARAATYLLPQADQRNTDVVLFGRSLIDGSLAERRWLYDRATGLFRADEPGIGDRGLEFFVAEAAAGRTSTLMGLPVGMGERFAVDYDGDKLWNGFELAMGTGLLDEDSDDDGDPDGHEASEGGDPLDGGVQSSDTTPAVVSNLRLVWITTNTAKIAFDTDEPTTFTGTWTTGNFSGDVASKRPDTHHWALLQNLRDNKVHDLALSITDLGGNITAANMTGLTTEPFRFPTDVIFRNTNVLVSQDSAGTLAFTVSGRARRKGGGNAQNNQLRMRVLINGVVQPGIVFGVPADGDGVTSADISASGLQPGDVVTAVVETIWDMNQNTGVNFNFPETIPANRAFEVTYTGAGA